MSIVNINALKGLGAQLWWSGSYAESGAYDDDGNKRGFLILPDGVTVTPSGTFTTQKMKDGRNIWKFDGSSNRIDITTHDAWNFRTGDFTICAWFKVVDATSNYGIIVNGTQPTISGTGFILELNGNGSDSKISFFANGWPNRVYTPANAYSANTWTYVTVRRASGVLKIYVNCVELVSSAFTHDITNTQNPSIGSYGTGWNAYYYLNGNIKDLQVFKGKALTQDQIAAIMAETFIY